VSLVQSNAVLSSASLYASRAYGLSIVSNLPIPGLAASPASEAAVDVRVYLGEIPPCLRNLELSALPFFAAKQEEPDGLRMLALGSNHLHLHYADGTEFVLNRAGSEIWAAWGSKSSLEDAATYLLGPVFGFLLRLRGITCLHAAAVAVDGLVAALVGPAGSGKSTLAAAMAQTGFVVVSEDVLPIEEAGGRYFVQPGYPRIRLWPDSAAALFGSTDALPRLTPNWEKLYLGLQPPRFQPQPLPLGAIYLLNTSDDASPRISEISSRDALIALVANTYANGVLDENMRAAEFRTLSPLAELVPVRQLLLPDNFKALPSACDLLIENFRSAKLTAQNCNV